MRWLRLYLRSRRIPLALLTATVTSTLVWALWLAFSDRPVIGTRFVSLTVTLAVTAFAATLAGADDELDHTAATSWPVRRAGHLLLTATAIIAPLLLSTVTHARFAPLAVVVRDTAGILGLTALGADLVGAAWSWLAPLVWTLVTVVPLLDPDAGPHMRVVVWSIEPAGSTAAAACAGVLAVTG
ncbi:hypothetical protein ACFQ0D_33355, partial [Micromonospora zhanjiangensis]